MCTARQRGREPWQMEATFLGQGAIQTWPAKMGIWPVKIECSPTKRKENKNGQPSYIARRELVKPTWESTRLVQDEM